MNATLQTRHSKDAGKESYPTREARDKTQWQRCCDPIQGVQGHEAHLQQNIALTVMQ